MSRGMPSVGGAHENAKASAEYSLCELASEQARKVQRQYGDFFHKYPPGVQKSHPTCRSFLYGLCLFLIQSIHEQRKKRRQIKRDR